jgi:hypothetical protein
MFCGTTAYHSYLCGRYLSLGTSGILWYFVPCAEHLAAEIFQLDPEIQRILLQAIGRSVFRTKKGSSLALEGPTTRLYGQAS